MVLKQCKSCHTMKNIKGKKIICKRCEDELKVSRQNPTQIDDEPEVVIKEHKSLNRDKSADNIHNTKTIRKDSDSYRLKDTKLCICGHEKKNHICTIIDYTGKFPKTISNYGCIIGDCECKKFKEKK